MEDPNAETHAETHAETLASDSSDSTVPVSDVKGKRFTAVLPVLFYEYLAISLTKSLVPTMLINTFTSNAYLAVGVTETLKGMFAFITCPLWGRLSDQVGRKVCLLITIIGSTLPVAILAFTSNMYIYSIALSLSGLFSGTFPLTFAYISDCVKDKKKLAPAYGLALATFGLSFSIGPLAGSYIANQMGSQVVFILSLVLIVINAWYIIFSLPETVVSNSILVLDTKTNAAKVSSSFMNNLGNPIWNISDTFRVFSSDPFMTNLALIVFLYYTSVWAMVSTMMVYVTRVLHFSPVTLGWLLSGYGLATMFSEGVVVRIVVPYLGEKNSIRIGLASFAIQCCIVAGSTSSFGIFLSILFSMLSNLVYPSISSLVSKVVEQSSQGEALGALNGIKALTEGFGPLSFGLLMALFENTPSPGAPYILASLLCTWAFLHTFELPPEPEIVYAKHHSKRSNTDSLDDGDVDESVSLLSGK